MDAGTARRRPGRADPPGPRRDAVRAVGAGPGHHPRRGRDRQVRGMSPAPVVPLDEWLARAAKLAPRRELFIDGRFVPAASGRTFTDVTGRDGSTIAEVAEGGTEDVDAAVAAARR